MAPPSQPEYITISDDEEDNNGKGKNTGPREEIVIDDDDIVDQATSNIFDPSEIQFTGMGKQVEMLYSQQGPITRPIGVPVIHSPLFNPPRRPRRPKPTSNPPQPRTVITIPSSPPSTSSSSSRPTVRTRPANSVASSGRKRPAPEDSEIQEISPGAAAKRLRQVSDPFMLLKSALFLCILIFIEDVSADTLTFRPGMDIRHPKS